MSLALNTTMTRSRSSSSPKRSRSHPRKQRLENSIVNMFEAIDHGNLDTVKQWMEKGTDVDCRDDLNQTPLMRACVTGQLQIVEYLISNGAKVNLRQGYFGETPLLAACARGDVELCKILIDAGAHVNTRTGTGQTPVMCASSKGYWDVVEYLAGQKAKLDHRDQWGRTALLIATSLGLEDVCEELCDKGAKVDKRDHEGRTPLHEAAAAGKVSLVQLFLEYGASATKRDGSGRSPLDVAIEAGNREIVELLRTKETEELKESVMAGKLVKSNSFEFWKEDSGRDTPDLANSAPPSPPKKVLALKPLDNQKFANLDTAAHMLTNIPHVRTYVQDVVDSNPTESDQVIAARDQVDRLVALLNRALEREVEISKSLYDKTTNTTSLDYPKDAVLE